MNKIGIAKRILLILLFSFTIFGFSFCFSLMDSKYAKEIDKLKTEIDLLKNIEEPEVVIKEQKSITKTSDLTNDSNYQNKDDVEEIVKSQGYQTKKQIESSLISKDYATNDYVNKEVDDLDKKITKLSNKLDGNVKEVFDVIYPVGSTFISKTKTPPAYGTWELMEEGRFIEATETDGEGGTTKEPGLPNIVGMLDPRWRDNTAGGTIFGYDNYAKGAFYLTQRSVMYSKAANSGTYYSTIHFDAKKGETKEDGETTKSDSDYHVYGQSDTVQPKSQKMYIYIRVE